MCKYAYCQKFSCINAVPSLCSLIKSLLSSELQDFAISSQSFLLLFALISSTHLQQLFPLGEVRGVPPWHRAGVSLSPVTLLHILMRTSLPESNSRLTEKKKNAVSCCGCNSQLSSSRGNGTVLYQLQLEPEAKHLLC